MKRPVDWNAEEDALVGELADQLAALRARHAGDPPLALLGAARERLLPEGPQEHIARHLESSAWSRTLLEDFDQTLAPLTGDAEARLLALIRTAARPPRRATLAGLGRALVPLATLAAMFVLVIRLPQWQGPLPSRPTNLPAFVPSAVEASPAFTTWVLALSKPTVRLGLEWLPRRGEAAASAVEDFKAGLDAFQRDEYPEAVRRLSALTTVYRDSVEVFLYLGVSRLFEGDAAGARADLAVANRLATGGFRDDVAWYLAVAEERLGDTAAARRRVSALCRGGGPRAGDACAAAAQWQ